MNLTWKQKHQPLTLHTQASDTNTAPTTEKPTKQSQLLGAEHKQLLEKNPKEQIWFLKNSSSFLRHYFNLSRFWHGFFAPLCRAFREEAVIRKAMCLAACTVFFLQPCRSTTSVHSTQWADDAVYDQAKPRHWTKSHPMKCALCPLKRQARAVGSRNWKFSPSDLREHNGNTASL